jgi:adenylate kinase family enzyme
MNRILVIGCSGTGKSTLSAKLAKTLNLPLINLDSYFWKPGWVATSRNDWLPIVEELAASPRWIMDGNFDWSFHIRMPRADAIIFLELPRIICIYRVLRRWISYKGRSRPDMAPGCPEKMDMEFLLWVWRFNKAIRPIVQKALVEYAKGEHLYHLKTLGEIKRFELTTLRRQRLPM